MEVEVFAVVADPHYLLPGVWLIGMRGFGLWVEGVRGGEGVVVRAWVGGCEVRAGVGVG